MPYDTPLTLSATDEIYSLWDRLAHFPASETEAALLHLLEALCRISDADNAYWLGAIRLADCAPEDPMMGWRPRVIRYLNGHDERMKLFLQLSRESERRPDSSMLAQIRKAGEFRGALKRELVPEEWFESEYNQRVNLSWGITDTLFVTTPVNEDCEAYIALQRKRDAEDLFTRDDLQRAASALRGLIWFQRRVFLSYGLVVSETPLTPVERKVLGLLLTDKPEKLIAAEMDQTPATTHSYVRDIYRKLGVKSRAALAAIWLGH
ncbi:helix-turn-helix domain-containing protein [Billgrantia endophytica]|uniref:Helix-turn-helix transcriptional regulator n=1 Tax=Billgrantia endophytica TaxID=2033802 RepID=A0A2N7TUX2_9GAMM|nr:helix-turn-helix transcriptional regulator [Halomonas endophytica]PMR71992.1 helix-turn-helix transcriptional regulator [Halomonas endophytica]